MEEHKITRRNFLRTAAVGTTALALPKPKRLSAGAFETVRIEEPFHGAVLNRRHGEQLNNGLKIHVSGRAPMRDRVTVNGNPTRRKGSHFSSEVILKDKETEIIS
ncbi:MAG: twin-arginine translocation signal domain-containing protein, partial [Planctomycetota bacterium]